MSSDSEAPKNPEVSADYIAAFKRRRQVQRIANLLTIVSIITVMALPWFLGRRESSDAFCIVPLVLIIGIAAVAFTQSNWHCPSCGGSFASWQLKINPWYTPEPLKCPHCGTKLL